MIAQPDAKDDDVTYSVNTMLKAISASLLMEQVLTPDFKFKARKSNSDRNTSGELHIKGFKNRQLLILKRSLKMI